MLVVPFIPIHLLQRDFWKLQVNQCWKNLSQLIYVTKTACKSVSLRLMCFCFITICTIIKGFQSVSFHVHKMWIEILLHQMSLIAGGKCQSFESNLHFELPCKLQCVKLFIKLLISFWCKALVHMSKNHFYDSYFLKLKYPWSLTIRNYIKKTWTIKIKRCFYNRGSQLL